MNFLIKLLLKIIIGIVLVLVPFIVFVMMKLPYICSNSGGLYVGIFSILLLIIFEAVFISSIVYDLFKDLKKKTIFFFYLPLIVLTIVNLLILIFSHPISSGSC